MSSELSKGIFRIGSNYARLVLTVILGILLVPLILEGATDVGFGLWGLLGATAGLGDMFKEVVQTSMNRELGDAYHSDDDHKFRRVFNSALVVSLCATLFGVLIYGIIYFVIPMLNITDDWIAAARTVVLFQALASCVSIACAPLFNLYLIAERMITYNLLLVFERSSYFWAAIVWVVLNPSDDPQQTLVQFAATGAIITVIVVVLAAVSMLILDKRTRPSRALVDRAEVRSIITTSGWNGVMTIALNMHIRLSQLLVNIWFGLTANAIFAAAVRLSSYIRMVTTGMTDGLDIVAARLTAQNQKDSIGKLLPQITKFHGLIAIPACVVVFIYTPALLEVWVGKHFEKEQLEICIITVRVLAIGMAARGVSDGWLRVLYGAGYIQKYAPLILIGGAINPLLSFALFLSLPNNEASQTVLASFHAPAIAFTLIFIGIHFGGVQLVVRKYLGVSPVVLCKVLFRPVIIGLVIGGVAYTMREAFPVERFRDLLVHFTLIGAALLPLLVIVGFDKDETRVVKEIVVKAISKLR